jgi:hypothetical protein
LKLLLFAKATVNIKKSANSVFGAKVVSFYLFNAQKTIKKSKVVF